MGALVVTRTWVFQDVYGVWIAVVKAQTEKAARSQLTRTQRRKATQVRESISTTERRQAAAAAGLPFPVPVKRAKAFYASLRGEE